MSDLFCSDGLRIKVRRDSSMTWFMSQQWIVNILKFKKFFYTYFKRNIELEIFRKLVLYYKGKALDAARVFSKKSTAFN